MLNVDEFINLDTHGTYCEQIADPCSSISCENNGICFQDGSQITCICSVRNVMIFIC